MGSNSLSYIGLAYRAGKTLVGTAACEAGIRKGKVRLLILQDSISRTTKKKFVDLCSRFDIDVLTLNGYDRLGLAIGRAEILVIGITDRGFAGAIKNTIDGG
ncbi:MAG: L7Ae/L30e/S12e/Gadd45 family ribosomal protein [Christensenellales bacterium]